MDQCSATYPSYLFAALLIILLSECCSVCVVVGLNCLRVSAVVHYAFDKLFVGQYLQ